MKLLYVIFCILIYLPAHSQVSVNKGFGVKSINKKQLTKLDSLRQKLKEVSEPTAANAYKRLVIQNEIGRLSKNFSKATAGNCDGYFCRLDCINSIASINAGKNPVCANTTTSLTVSGVTGTNPVVTWWTGSGATGTKLGTGETLPNRGAGIYYARITGQCGVPGEESIRIDSFPGKSDTTATVCNSFTWHGVTYYRTGDKVYTTTNAAGCDSVINLHLTILSIPNTFSKTDVGCYGSATGSITIAPTSGVAPFTYRIGTVGPITAPSGTFNNLKAGTYRAYVQDATGCIGVAAPIVVAQSVKIGATTTPTAVTGCTGGTNGKITITNPVGFPPFQYKLGSSGNYAPFTAPYDITGLKAGNYIVYIKDNNGCIGSTGSVAVTQPALIMVGYTKTDPNCQNPKGTIILSTPGIVNADYKIAPGSIVYSAQNTFNNLVADTYYGYAKDANGCVGRVGPITLLPATGCTPFVKNIPLSTTENGSGKMQISLSPNPSQNTFTLTVQSTNLQQPIRIRVLDAVGRIMYETKGLPGQLFRFGEQLRTGLYLVEIRQGDELRTLKAVKVD